MRPNLVLTSASLLLRDDELDAPVLLTPRRRLVGLDRLIGPNPRASIREGSIPRPTDAGARSPHATARASCCAALFPRESVCPSMRTVIVGRDFKHVADLVEQREAARLDRRLVGVEEDLLLELDLLLGDDDVLVLLRAAVVVGRPGLVRALVGRVERRRPCRCRDRGSRPRPRSRPCPRARSGTCRSRRRGRPCRCRDRGSRPRPRTCPCPRARSGTCR